MHKFCACSLSFSVRHKHRNRSMPLATTLDLPPVLYSEQGRNITYLLGETVLLKCTVLGYKQGMHTVSWTRTTARNLNPTALTFGSKVIIKYLNITPISSLFWINRYLIGTNKHFRSWKWEQLWMWICWTPVFFFISVKSLMEENHTSCIAKVKFGAIYWKGLDHLRFENMWVDPNEYNF